MQEPQLQLRPDSASAEYVAHEPARYELVSAPACKLAICGLAESNTRFVRTCQSVSSLWSVLGRKPPIGQVSCTCSRPKSW